MQVPASHRAVAQRAANGAVPLRRVALSCAVVQRAHAARRRFQPVRAVWDDSMTLADLRQQLDAALKVEDYALVRVL